MKELVAILDGRELRAPAPGWFRPLIAADHLVMPNDVIGELEQLGRVTNVLAPHVTGMAKLSAGRRAVSYGDVVMAVVPFEGMADTSVETKTSAGSEHGLVFRAPSSGRYYGRSSPDKPAFVKPGDNLAPGATVCLLEVMKTFHRVNYDGTPARVREVLVADGADVNAGDPLLALDAIT